MTVAKNKCLEKCSEAMPPYIMEEGELRSPPEVTSAAEDSKILALVSGSSEKTPVDMCLNDCAA